MPLSLWLTELIASQQNSAGLTDTIVSGPNSHWKCCYWSLASKCTINGEIWLKLHWLSSGNQKDFAHWAETGIPGWYVVLNWKGRPDRPSWALGCPLDYTLTIFPHHITEKKTAGAAVSVVLLVLWRRSGCCGRMTSTDSRQCRHLYGFGGRSWIYFSRSKHSAKFPQSLWWFRHHLLF